MRCRALVLRAWPLLTAMSLAAIPILTGSALAEDTIVRVEEDWELVVATPDAASDAPQVTCTISPTGNLDGIHAVLELNQQSLPAYVPGGLQLQVWNGETPLTERKFPNAAVMATAGETVRWTQTMRLADGNLVFEVTQGTSTTWGSFGGQGYLTASLNTTLAGLNAYHPAVSVAHSRIGYAANRVQSLVLKAVRLTTSAGQVLEDTTPRVVHAQE